ncbi:expressed unknown protein [Seminavis robusta]|uniref:Uncharacterized protein n=1 Tax=Seminavis robusta TaxID=568900 RepID=A0A9N8E9X9_9STRA|nr:expressed unknown protein [Seminavis robusta]|eukprot:Sro861_g212300.1 n/a (96) ;mRNA; r:31596-32251
MTAARNGRRLLRGTRRSLRNGFAGRNQAQLIRQLIRNVARRPGTDLASSVWELSDYEYQVVLQDFGQFLEQRLDQVGPNAVVPGGEEGRNQGEQP